MKRFYREATVAEADGGWAVLLDGRRIKTAGGHPQIVPTQALARMLAGEWANQGEVLDPGSFPARALADHAIDIVAPAPQALADRLLGYAETDTLCYRADPDDPLWHRQQSVWEPLVEQTEAREGIRLERVSGVMHRPLRSAARDTLQARLAALDPFALTALDHVTGLAASVCIGLAALAPDADGEALWNAANLEEDWQIERWGADAAAADRRARRRESFLAGMAFAQAAQ